MRDIHYLDDIRVGQRFSTGSHRLTEGEIIAFARSFDPQPFHTDPVAARQSFFAGLAASGWHTAALSMRLQVESGPVLATDDAGGGGMIGASVEVAWPRPTRPGDVLRVDSEVLAVTPSRSRPDRGFVTLRSETRNQDGAVLQVQTTKLLVWRRKEG